MTLRIPKMGSIGLRRPNNLFVDTYFIPIRLGQLDETTLPTKNKMI